MTRQLTPDEAKGLHWYLDECGLPRSRWGVLRWWIQGGKTSSAIYHLWYGAGGAK